MSSSAQTLLDSDPFGFGRFVNTPERKVVILWDYVNCPVPRGISVLSAVRNIREAALKFGSIDQFEAYSYWSNNTNLSTKNDLSTSGVKLRDCPYDRKKDMVDKTLLIDMMVYSLERPRTTTIVLISGDRDWAYAISTLRNRGYAVKLLAPAKSLQSSLQVPTDLLDWNSIFQPDLPSSELIDFSALVHGKEEEEETDEEEEEDEEEDEGEDEEEEDEGGVEEKEQQELELEVEVEVEVERGEEVKVGSEVKVDVEVAEVENMIVQGDGSTPPAPPQSEPFTIPDPAEIRPSWSPDPAPPELPSFVVPPEPLSARAPKLLETPPPPHIPSPSPPRQPRIATPSSGSGSSRPGMGGSLFEQPSRYVPPNFVQLVEELESLKKSGSQKPTWSSLCVSVKARRPNILSEAGVKKWKDYMLLAEKEGLVINGRGPHGIETAALKI